MRLLPLSFLGLIGVGTVLLSLPATRAGDHSPTFMDSFFAATSAATVTGLSTVDIGSYWSFSGLLIILLLVEIGGIGFLAMATVLGLFIGGRLGLRTQLTAQVDLHVVSVGDVAPLFKRVAITVFIFQGVAGLFLTLRYRMHYFDSWADSVWHGIFDAVMAFNNAGFSLNADSLGQYSGDAFVIVPIGVLVFFGAIGFPVLAELYQGWRKPKAWTIHTRLTVWGSLVLFAIATVSFLAFEWNNPGTLGGESLRMRLVTGIEAGIMPRSGGLASFDWNEVTGASFNIATIFMFIGGGSASTAGGIKVTTFFLLAYVVLAEVRGDPEVRIGVRSISSATIRTAFSIAAIAISLVAVSALLMMVVSDAEYSHALFEVTSAFGTVGLSTGLSGEVGFSGQMVLIVLMFIGRVGTITAASTFLLRRRQQRFHLPEERPIIG